MTVVPEGTRVFQCSSADLRLVPASDSLRDLELCRCVWFNCVGCHCGFFRGAPVLRVCCKHGFYRVFAFPVVPFCAVFMRVPMCCDFQQDWLATDT